MKNSFKNQFFYSYMIMLDKPKRHEVEAQKLTAETRLGSIRKALQSKYMFEQADRAQGGADARLAKLLKKPKALISHLLNNNPAVMKAKAAFVAVRDKSIMGLMSIQSKLQSISFKPKETVVNLRRLKSKLTKIRKEMEAKMATIKASMLALERAVESKLGVADLVRAKLRFENTPTKISAASKDGLYKVNLDFKDNKEFKKLGEWTKKSPKEFVDHFGKLPGKGKPSDKFNKEIAKLTDNLNKMAMRRIQIMEHMDAGVTKAMKKPPFWYPFIPGGPFRNQMLKLQVPTWNYFGVKNLVKKRMKTQPGFYKELMDGLTTLPLGEADLGFMDVSKFSEDKIAVNIYDQALKMKPICEDLYKKKLFKWEKVDQKKSVKKYVKKSFIKDKKLYKLYFRLKARTRLAKGQNFEDLVFPKLLADPKTNLHQLYKNIESGEYITSELKSGKGSIVSTDNDLLHKDFDKLFTSPSKFKEMLSKLLVKPKIASVEHVGSTVHIGGEGLEKFELDNFEYKPQISLSNSDMGVGAGKTNKGFVNPMSALQEQVLDHPRKGVHAQVLKYLNSKNKGEFRYKKDVIQEMAGHISSGIDKHQLSETIMRERFTMTIKGVASPEGGSFKGNLALAEKRGKTAKKAFVSQFNLSPEIAKRIKVVGEVRGPNGKVENEGQARKVYDQLATKWSNRSNIKINGNKMRLYVTRFNKGYFKNLPEGVKDFLDTNLKQNRGYEYEMGIALGTNSSLLSFSSKTVTTNNLTS